MSDIALPKNQAVLDRLRKRLEGYRNHHEETGKIYEHSVNGLNDEQKQQTALLRQRFIDAKAKKSQKKSEKKHDSSVSNNKAKRQLEDPCELGNTSTDNYEPPKKVAGNGNPPAFAAQGSSPSGLKGPGRTAKSKFLPENRSKNGYQASGASNIMSPLSGATPVTVHTHVEKQDAYVDFDQSLPVATLEKDGPDGIFNTDTFNDLISEISDMNPDFMKEFDFGDDEEKSDSLGVGNLNSGGNSTNSGAGENPPSSYPVTPITPTNSPMHHQLGVKMESDSVGNIGLHASAMGHQCAGPSPAPATTASPLASQLSSTGGTPPYPSSMFDPSGSPANNSSISSNSTKVSSRVPYNSPAPPIPIVDSPAAQTLKQMAEQHQHKAQLGLSSQPRANASPARSPFTESYSNFQTAAASSSSNEFMCATSNVNSNTNTASSTQFTTSRQTSVGQSPSGESMGSIVKQEVYSPTTQTTFSPGFMDVKRATSQTGHRMPQQVMSPVSKSFNNSAGMEPSLLHGQSFIPRASTSNPSNYSSFQNNSAGGLQNSISSASQQVPGRGSPSGAADAKARLTMVNQQQQQQQCYFYTNNNLHGGGVTQGGSPVDPQFNMQGLPQQNGPQGQTINFTQQHLRPPNGNMGPRMGPMPPGMNRMPGAGGPSGRISQQPPPQVPQQQMLIQRQQLINSQQPGMNMINRFPPSSSNPPTRGPTMSPMMGPQQQQQMMNGPSRPQMQQAFGSGQNGHVINNNGQMINNMPMRHMSPYNNNGNHVMGMPNGIPPSQPPPQRGMQMGSGEWMPMDPATGVRHPQFPQNQMGRQGPRQYSGMQMQQQQPGVMGGSYGGMGQGPQGCVVGNPNMGFGSQMQQISGFNSQQNAMKMCNPASGGAPGEPGNYNNANSNSFAGSMKSGAPGVNMLCSNSQQQPQSQQQLFSNQSMKPMGQISTDMIDQMISNITDDNTGFNAGDDFLHSLESNSNYQLSNILDNL